MNCTPGMMFWTLLLAFRFPVSAIAPWLIPWYPPENDMTVPRPVAVLHSLIAASVASEPDGEQNCTLAFLASSGGMIESRFSTNSSFMGVTRSSVWSEAPDWINPIIAWLTSSSL